MQSQLKVLAPVITRDVTLPNSSKKVPMVMIHVPDSQTIMAIPLSTLSQMSNTTTSTTNTTTTTGTGATPTPSFKDEQQAKDLLNWTDGIGTLDGCDLRFKINQLGCLELLDSDDESNPDYLAGKQQRSRQPPPAPYLHNSQQHQPHHYQQQQQQQQQQKQYEQHCQDEEPMQIQDREQTKVNLNNTNSNNTSSSSTTNGNTNSTISGTSSTSSGNSTNNKKANRIKQISPGSSLLRDGPDNRRSRASSSSTTPTPTPTTNNITINSNDNKSLSQIKSDPLASMPLSKRNELNQQTFLMEKLIPKERLDEIKSVVESWSIEDVKKFVDSIPGCAGNGQLFESQQICGKSLMYLDQKELIDIINIKLGPAIKIYNAISLIKP